MCWRCFVFMYSTCGKTLRRQIPEGIVGYMRPGQLARVQTAAATPWLAELMSGHDNLQADKSSRFQGHKEASAANKGVQIQEK